MRLVPLLCGALVLSGCAAAEDDDPPIDPECNRRRFECARERESLQRAAASEVIAHRVLEHLASTWTMEPVLDECWQGVEQPSSATLVVRRIDLGGEGPSVHEVRPGPRQDASEVDPPERVMLCMRPRLEEKLRQPNDGILAWAEPGDYIEAIGDRVPNQALFGELVIDVHWRPPHLALGRVRLELADP